ncbi:MAG: glycosyltransferase family 2 protein, partial [bacterium]
MKESAARPRVAIIIVSWNSWSHMEDCLASLQKVTYPNVEIVVVDNASADGSADRIAAFRPAITLLRNTKNLGSAGGNNVGMRYALAHGADYVWLLNADAEPEPDAVALLVEAAEAHPNAGMVAPVLFDFHQRNHVQNCGSIIDWDRCKVFHVTDPGAVATADASRYWVWATAVLMRRRLLETVGLYDERYFVYGDDLDLSARAIRSGFVNRTVIDAKVYHKSHYSGDVRALPLHYYFYTTRNRYFFWMRFLPWHRRVTFSRRYARDTITRLIEYKGSDAQEVADALCDSLFYALTGRGGLWDRSVKMPAWMKRLVIRHRFALVELLDFRIDRIVGGVVKKAARRLRRP